MHQRLRTDPQGPALGALFPSKSDVGPVLVSSTPPTPVQGERGAEGEKVPAAPASRPRGRPPKKAHPVKEAHVQTNLEADWQRQNYDKATSAVQLVPGDAVLLKQDAFQGKMKMKDRWGDEEYEVVHQVTPDMPAYEVHDQSGNARVVHRNRLFLVASILEPVTPLSLDAELLEVTSEPSTLAELTPLECESDSPDETTWEMLT